MIPLLPILLSASALLFLLGLALLPTRRTVGISLLYGAGVLTLLIGWRATWPHHFEGLAVAFLAIFLAAMLIILTLHPRSNALPLLPTILLFLLLACVTDSALGLFLTLEIYWIILAIRSGQVHGWESAVIGGGLLLFGAALLYVRLGGTSFELLQRHLDDPTTLIAIAIALVGGVVKIIAIFIASRSTPPVPR
ncbi:MAG: hypothetical protein WCJ56_06530 [bacterium]